MIVSPNAHVSFRFVDTRKAPNVFAIALAARRPDGSAMATTDTPLHAGKALTLPFYLGRFAEIDKRHSRRMCEKARTSKMKTRRSRDVLRKWNVWPDEENTPYHAYEEIKEDEYEGNAHYLPLLLTYACPAHARAQARIIAPEVPAATATPTRQDETNEAHACVANLSLADAKFLSERMKVPLCVVLDAWCVLKGEDTPRSADDFLPRLGDLVRREPEQRVEMYLRMPSSLLAQHSYLL